MNLLISLSIVILPNFLAISATLISFRHFRSFIGSSVIISISFWVSIYLNPNLVEQPRESTINVVDLFLRVLSSILLGTFFSIPFEFPSFIGRMIDTFRGVQFQEQVAPELGPRDSKLEIIFSLIILIFILNFGFLRETIKFMVETSAKYTFVNNIEGYSSIFLRESTRLMEFLVLVTRELFNLSILVILPLIVILLLIEISSSFLSRIIPKLTLGSELSLLRAALGLISIKIIVLYSEAFLVAFDYYKTILEKFVDLFIC